MIERLSLNNFQEHCMPATADNDETIEHMLLFYMIGWRPATDK